MSFLTVAKHAAVATAALAAMTLQALALETKPYDAAAFKAAQAAGSSILVDVHADWCPTCKAQRKVLDSLKGKPEFAKVTVFQVSFDDQKDAVKAFGANKQSTLIGFKGDKETARSMGATSSEAIEGVLKSTLK